MIILQKSALTLVEKLKKIEIPPPLGPFLCKNKSKLHNAMHFSERDVPNKFIKKEKCVYR
jgi:hypothetical protein